MASIMRWDPFGDLLALPREMDRLFERSLLPLPGTHRTGENMLIPTMDVMTRGDDMVMRIELPGIKPEDVDISVTDDVLTVSGERRAEHETAEEDYVVRESTWGSFERRMALPKGLDADTIRADFTDGVLTITVPKAKALEEPKTHHIAVGHGTKH